MLMYLDFPIKLYSTKTLWIFSKKSDTMSLFSFTDPSNNIRLAIWEKKWPFATNYWLNFSKLVVSIIILTICEYTTS